jgi:hypothetical protein
MDDFPVIAERMLDMLDMESKQSVRLRILIGKPYWVDAGDEAACPVAIHGLVGRVSDIHGVDLSQALELAIAFVNSLLNSISPLKKLTWTDGEPYSKITSEVLKLTSSGTDIG